MDFIRRISAVELPPRKFFAWPQELRQPLIAMPLRVICSTEAWKRVIRAVKRDEQKQAGGEAQNNKRARKAKRAAKKQALLERNGGARQLGAREAMDAWIE